MRRDGLNGLILVVAAALLAIWLSALNDRPAVEPVLADAHASHSAMVEQMRRDVDLPMIERMNEPEWREMRRPGMLAEMEAHQRATDRMLGRAP